MPGSTRTPWHVVAKVIATRGLKGEVAVEMTCDLPFSIFEGKHVDFVPPQLRGTNGARVESVSEDSHGCTARFSDVLSIDDAERLVGRFVLVSRSDIPKGFNSADDIVGRRVVCVDHGDLGTVTSLIHTPANDVIQVEGPLGEVLIPVIDDCEVSIPDDAGSPIRVRLLPGLIPEGED